MVSKAMNGPTAAGRRRLTRKGEDLAQAAEHQRDVCFGKLDLPILAIHLDEAGEPDLRRVVAELLEGRIVRVEVRDGLRSSLSARRLQS